MNIVKLLEQKTDQLENKNYISFSKEELDVLRPDQAGKIIEKFHGSVLMKIPDEEIEFFEWLSREDPVVWNDLWKDEENLYLVSIDLLTQFISGGAGFPICDLVDQPNYWFNARHIKPKGQEYLEIILEKLESGVSLNLAEYFLLQISTVPTDIWHYCFQNNIRVKTMKDAVEEMIYNGWVVHLSDREDLVKYIDI